jgi:hypothetical protein
MKRKRARSVRRWSRARFLGAYLEDPPRAGLKPDPVAVMQAVGAPLCDIPEVAATLP